MIHFKYPHRFAKRPNGRETKRAMETTLLLILEINNGVDYGQISLVLNNGPLFSFLLSFLCNKYLLIV